MKTRKVIYSLLISFFLVSSNVSQKILADEEITFVFCEQSGVLKAFNIIGKVITIVKILVPVILIITSGLNLFKAVLNEDDSQIRKSVELFIAKICVGACIFFVPTIMGTFFSVVHKYDKTIIKFSECGSCLIGASGCKTLISASEKKEERELLSKMEEFEKQVEENEEKKQNEMANLTSPSTQGTPSTSISYGKGCSGYVSSSSYNSSIASQILQIASTKVGVSYSKMDCSDFVSYVYSSYVPDSTAAGLGKTTKNKCVRQDEVRPGDIFFTSNYDRNGVCKHCNGATFGNRCNRYNCIMHVGIVTEVVNGKVTKIVHSSGKGVHYKSPSYLYSPNGSGSSWYIGFSRPYA